MVATKAQLRKLEAALKRAGTLSLEHSDAVKKAQVLFAEVFGEDVPEEALGLRSATPREEVGHLFNEAACHGEPTVPWGEVAKEMNRLMNEPEDE